MLDKIVLWAGTQETKLEVPASPVTLFIGPNNSGKTLLLKEIGQELRRAHGAGRGVDILLDLHYRFPDPDDIGLLLTGSGGRKVPTRTAAGAPADTDNDWFHVSRPKLGSDWRVSASLGDALKGHNVDLHQLAGLLSAELEIAQRLEILSDNQGPHSIVASLAMDPVQCRELSDLVSAAIGWHFSVQWGPRRSLRAMLNRERLPRPLEQSYADEASAFHAKGKPLTDLSEGIRSFVGILAAYLWADLRVFVIDEPEAFLHPPLARKLGRLVAEQSHKMKATTVAATHSPEFLMGCVQSGVPTTVVRLTYEDEVPSFRILESKDLTSFMREPRLRSTGVLNALFHKCAIVTEADVDRAFYEEANRRLLAETGANGGAEECCFLNVNGKDSLDRVVCMLRRMGLPAAAIVDLDMIEEGALTSLLKAANMPESTRNMISAAKPKIIESFSGKLAKECGVAGSANPGAVEDLLNMMADYGVFLVPVGELEHWLSQLGVAATKQRWLSQIFDRMGCNPADPGYVRPAEGDVWAFVRRIGRWFRDPNRKGMPV